MRSSRITCMLLLRFLGDVSGCARGCAEPAGKLQGRLEQASDAEREAHVRSKDEQPCIDDPEDPLAAASGNCVHEGKASDQVGKEQGARKAGAGYADDAWSKRGSDCQRREEHQPGWISERRQVGPIAREPPGGADDTTSEIEIEREYGRPIGR